ncbi:hypothetical protein VVR26_06325 [Corynebacterium camporealensis]|uniref:hypothetical protein n=1 Tax=Corynebacterium camporealensis TaxID=161896 RepID=UPI0034CE2C05
MRETAPVASVSIRNLKGEQISDFTSEVSKIASRTVKDMELGPKATTAKNAVSDFVSEVSNLAKGTFKK